MTSLLVYVFCGGLLFCMVVAEMMTDQQSLMPDAAKPNAEEAGSTLTFVPKYCKLLDATQLEKLKESLSVGTVYFYKKKGRVDSFLTEYDKSAGFLNAYGLSLGLVDCSGSLTEDLEKACGEADDRKVYTYKSGFVILTLELDHLFDVNSIMSNILQLALLDEVIIVQSKKNRQNMEHDSAGQMDIIYSYHNAIGTYEHRVFMEIAYAYQDKYKFVVTTEPSTTTDLQDANLVTDNTVCMMWVLYCKERYNAASGCRSVNYRGDFTLLALATFFKQLSWPRVLYQSDLEGANHPCEVDSEAACVFVFHSDHTKEEADKVIDSIQFDLHGMAGLIVSHLDSAVPRDGEMQDPQLALLKPGGEYIVKEGSWELDSIEYFISSHLFPISDDAPPSDTEEEHGEGFEPDMIDDMVVQVAHSRRMSINDAPNVPALTDKTFPATALDKNNKLVVVLFYIPFDSQGLLFLHPYQEAATELAALKGDNPSSPQLVQVNCFDWTDVCQKANITTYPVVYIYRNGEGERYRHALDKNVLLQTVMLLQAEQPLMLTTTKEVNSFVEGMLPDQSYSTIDNLVLLKLSKSKEEMETYKAVVKALETQMLFAIVSADVETTLVPDGDVLHVRRRDEVQPHDIVPDNLRDAQSIVTYLLNGQFDSFPELTFMNFPALYARKQPFAILFFDSVMGDAGNLQQTMVDIIRSKKVQDVIFCKMTLDDSNPVAERLLINYTDTVVLPSFAFVNHQKGEVHIMQGGEMKEEVMLSWLQAVQGGAVVPSKILDKGEWKPPGRHYDFLAKMYQDMIKKPNTPDCESGDCDRTVDSHMADAQSQQETEEQDAETRSQLLRLNTIKEWRKVPPHLAKDQEGEGDSMETVTATIEAAAAKKGQGKSMPPRHTEL